MGFKKTYSELYSDIKDYSYLSINTNSWPKNRYEAALRFIDIKKTDKVLDVGCGRGDLLNYIQQETDHAYGMDISKGNIAIARRLLKKNVKLSIQDITKKTNYQNNFFDIIILTDVIEHIPDKYTLFKELKRILKKGGEIVIGTPNVVKLKNRLRFLFGEYPYTSDKKIVIKDNCPIIFDGGHIQWFTFKTLKELATQFNLKIIKQFGYGKYGRVHNFYPELLSGAIGIILKK